MKKSLARSVAVAILWCGVVAALPARGGCETVVKWSGDFGAPIYFYRDGRQVGKAIMAKGPGENDFLLEHELGDIPQETIVEKYDNGKPKAKWLYAWDGRRKVFCRERMYHKNGALRMLTQRKGCMLEGLTSFFFENGKVEGVFPYKDGIVEGVAKRYRQSGKMHSEIPYQAGRVSGTMKVYHPSGRLDSETEFKDDQPNGVVRSYTESGKLLSEGKMAAGQYDGDYKEYFPDSAQVKIHKIYRNGKELFAWEYDEQGSMVKFTKAP